MNEFQYLGRWVSKTNFRTYVYNATEKRLVNSYAEYEESIKGGVWFDTRDLALTKIPKRRQRLPKVDNATEVITDDTDS